jgi:hypothetical protein
MQAQQRVAEAVADAAAARQEAAEARRAAAEHAAKVVQMEQEAEESQGRHQDVLWDYNKRLRTAEARAQHGDTVISGLMTKLTWAQRALTQAQAALRRHTSAATSKDGSVAR